MVICKLKEVLFAVIIHDVSDLVLILVISPNIMNVKGISFVVLKALKIQPLVYRNKVPTYSG